MDQVFGIVNSYAGIYPYLVWLEDIARKLDILKKRASRINVMPRETMEEKEDYEQKREKCIISWNKLVEENDRYLEKLEIAYPYIYELFIKSTPLSPKNLMRAVLLSENRRIINSLLTDILLANDDSRLNKFLSLSGMSQSDLKQFIAKNDIYSRADLLKHDDNGIIDAYNIKSIEMAREITRLFPLQCYNLRYLYQVNDLEGVDDFLKETKCQKEEIGRELTFSITYLKDLKAFKHLLRKAEFYGIELDPERYVYMALRNINPEIPIHILKNFEIKELHNADALINTSQITTEVLEYILRNIKIDLDSLLIDNENFVIVGSPSDYLKKFLRGLDLDRAINYRIL